jgi:hypothetical protein
MKRRDFIKMAPVAAAGVTTLGILPSAGFPQQNSSKDQIHIIGPKDGFTPQVGTLLSMLTWMRNVVVLSVQGLKKEELDYLYDPKANSIGSMLLHLAATERQYQIKTFDWKIDFRGDGKINWDAAMRLGEKARKSIKGNNLDYYLTILLETRSKTIEELRKRDDDWLALVDSAGFQGMPTNNYCKWFHVCEHESNHNGQIKWIKNRIPSAPQNSD